jgi:hypothetical protein
VVLRALADEVGQPVDGLRGIRVEAHEEAGGTRIVVSTPHPAATLAVCHAYTRIAEARAWAADPVESWLTAETGRIEGELAALDRSLSYLPELSPTFLTSREDALNTARIRVIEETMYAAEAAGNEIADEALARIVENAVSPILAALGRLLLEARRDERATLATGKAAAHPDVRVITARIRWLEARFIAQRANEVEAARTLEASMNALPPHADDARFGHALAELVRRVDAGHASSLDPAPLQVLAVLVARLEADEAVLAAREGPSHPERLAMRARLDALAASFARERDMAVGTLELAGRKAALLARMAPAERKAMRSPFAVHESRPWEVQKQAGALAVLLARLVDWRETARPPRWRTRVPCHLRAP